MAHKETPEVFAKTLQNSLDTYTATMQSACISGNADACFRAAEAWRTTADIAAAKWNDRPMSQWYPPPSVPVAISSALSNEEPRQSDAIVTAQQAVVAAAENAAQEYDPHQPDAPNTWKSVENANTRLEQLAAIANQACAQGKVEDCLRAAEAWRSSSDIMSLTWGSKMEYALPTYATSTPDYWIVSIGIEEAKAATLLDNKMLEALNLKNLPLSGGGAFILDRCGEMYLCTSVGAGIVPVDGYMAEGAFFEKNLSCQELAKRLSGYSLSIDIRNVYRDNSSYVSF